MARRDRKPPSNVVSIPSFRWYDHGCEVVEGAGDDEVAPTVAETPPRDVKAARRPWFQDRNRWFRWEWRDGTNINREYPEPDLRRRGRGAR